MKLLLKNNERDTDMVEATYTWTNSKKETRTILAFVIHVDCIEDADIKHQLSLDGMCDVEMSAI